jgi:Fe-S-cluster containining protein
MDSLPIIESCDGCGVCCMHMATPPYDAEELEELREHNEPVYADYIAARDSRLLQFTANGTDHVPCGWFDMVTRRCRHYEYRPFVCEMFQRGGWSCHSQRADAGLWKPTDEQDATVQHNRLTEDD